MIRVGRKKILNKYKPNADKFLSQPNFGQLVNSRQSLAQSDGNQAVEEEIRPRNEEKEYEMMINTERNKKWIQKRMRSELESVK